MSKGYNDKDKIVAVVHALRQTICASFPYENAFQCHLPVYFEQMRRFFGYFEVTSESYHEASPSSNPILTRDETDGDISFFANWFVVSHLKTFK